MDKLIETMETAADGIAGGDTLAVVRRLWTRMLTEPPVPGQSWDEAGGNSLQFLRLIFELEEILERSLPPGSFSVEMTDETLALAIDAAPLTTELDVGEATLPVVFLFPGVGGDEPVLTALRDDLAADVSLVTLGYPGWAVISDPSYGFADLIDDLTSRVERWAPAGPVRLAGYSYGGIVAFAVARQLRRAGREVAFLGLLDTDISTPAPRRSRGMSGLLGRLGKLPDLVSRENPYDNLSRTLAHYLLSPGARALSLRLLDPKRGWLRPGMRFSLDYWLCRLRRTDAARGWLQSLTEVEPGIGTWLFRSAERMAGESDDLGWRRFLPTLNIVEIPGDHFSMLAGRHRGALVQALLRRMTGPREAAGGR